MIPLYFLVSIIIPIILSYREDLLNTNNCQKGISYNSYYPFGFFVFFTILIEFYLYK